MLIAPTNPPAICLNTLLYKANQRDAIVLPRAYRLADVAIEYATEDQPHGLSTCLFHAFHRCDLVILPY